jgi:alanyl aminopeptidase
LAKEQMSTLADEAVEVLSAAERIAFLGNVEALLNAGSVTGAEYLGYLKSFGHDPEAGVVGAVLDSLSKVKMAFKTEDLEPLLAEYVRQALSPAVERFGLTPREGEAESVSLLRPQLFGWLGDTGQDTGVQAESRKLAEAYMADPSTVDPSLGAISLRIAAIRGDRTLFKAYLAKFEATTVPQEKENFLLALGRFRDPMLQRAVLDLTLSDKVPTSDFLTPASGVIQTEAGARLLMNWIEDQYDTISSRFADEHVGLLPYVAYGCSEEILGKATKFFSQPEHQVDGTLASLEKATDVTTDCLNLRHREGDSVREYLAQVAAD